jgi:enoyl-CoA hydratase
MSGSITDFHERHDRMLKIVVDNPAKRNCFSPEMMAQCPMRLRCSAGTRVSGSACSARRRVFHRRARHAEILRPNATRKATPEGNIDPFGHGQPLPQADRHRPCKARPSPSASK